MARLIAAMTARAVRLAQPRAAAYVAGNRLYQVTIRRPSTGGPTYDRATRELDVAAGDIVYEGNARITPLNPAGSTGETGGPTYWTDARVSIDDDTRLDPHVDDLVTVADTTQARLGHVAKITLRVVGISRGGLLPTGYVLAATTAEPSRMSR